MTAGEARDARVARYGGQADAVLLEIWSRTGHRAGNEFLRRGIAMIEPPTEALMSSAFWQRLDIAGCDAARLLKLADGFQLSGNAVFLKAGEPTALRYSLALAHDWSTREARVEGFMGNRRLNDHIARTTAGWMMNGRDFGMADVLDLDLGFTPATNMVQLKRIALAIGDEADFDVAWFDAGSDRIERLPQQYRRVTGSEYDYRSPTFDYRETLQLAPNGFAQEYPGLWTMISG
jgi:uncharacterized protein